MPPLETDCRPQHAVLWAASGFDDYGKATVSAAVAIMIRRQIGNKEAVGPKGNVIAVESTAVVDRDITVGSIVWFGNVDDIAATPIDLLEVVTYSEIPDIKGRNIRRVIGVMRYGDTLPTIA